MDDEELDIELPFRDRLMGAMEQALREWDDGVVWVDTTRRFPNESEQNVRYAPGEFAYKFGDRVAALLEDQA